MGAAPRVVVADDDPKFASVVLRVLGSAGLDGVIARSGTEALAAVERLQPAAIVLDVMMPPPDGFEVCRTLRHRGWSGGIIMATASDRAEDRSHAMALGADVFLRKPFPLTELVDAVRSLVL